MLSRGQAAGGRAGLRRVAAPARLRVLIGNQVGKLAGWLALITLLSCSSQPRTQNPSTLWVSFGQSELELVLADTEPPYY